MQKLEKETWKEFFERESKKLPDIRSMLLDNLRFDAEIKIEAKKVKYEGIIKNIDLFINILGIFLSITTSIWIGFFALPTLKSNINLILDIIILTLTIFILLVILRTILIYKFHTYIENEYKKIYKNGDEIYDRMLKKAVRDLNVIVSETKEYIDANKVKK